MKTVENTQVLELEIIATKDDKHYISYMNLTEWLNFRKCKMKSGFTYKAYQKGFSSYKLENGTN